MNNENRIILLFDLDCFYAQCEIVRLKLPADVPLALFQWNSALAVSYPARDRYKIKRGDGWDEVGKKSKNLCWRIHLNVLGGGGSGGCENEGEHSMGENAIDATKKDDTNDNDHNNNTDPIEVMYNEIYRNGNDDPEHIQKLQQTENHRRRLSTEGKACLKRYRVASQRIFQVTLQSLQRRISNEKKAFILERASIDEFYLDITEYCATDTATAVTATAPSSLEAQQQQNIPPTNTKVIGESSCSTTPASILNNESNAPFQRACQMAQWIRQDIYDELGFTMSAGISNNKMLAKLAASYGKPNGQAVILPQYAQSLLKQTKLRKVRHFGGKLGKRIATVYRQHAQQHAQQDGTKEYEDITMGDITALPLPALQKGLSSASTARFVFDACRGIETEPVKETMGALVKSITAFKSFQATTEPDVIRKWIEVMANEIASRVESDSKQNRRYPRTCTLHYGMGREKVTMKSIRLQFPPKHSKHKSADLMQQSMKCLAQIKLPIRRVGLAASNFDSADAPEGHVAIDRFFSKQQTNDGGDGGQERNGEIKSHMLKPKSPGKKRPHRAIIANPNKNEEDSNHSSSYYQSTNHPSNNDLVLAQRLQAKFDRENYILSTSAKYQHKQKIRKIDSFFGKK